MSRTIEAGQLGIIFSPFIAADTPDNDLDGMEDTIAFSLEDDIVVEETLCARVLVVEPGPFTEEYTETLRERAVVAADIARQIMLGGDPSDIIYNVAKALNVQVTFDTDE